jgi:CRP/FNR family transcriptional regulator, cyclic AMP receptor protein
MTARPQPSHPNRVASKTPKTDAIERFMHTPGRPPVGFVLSEFARRLENELSVALDVAHGRATLADLERVQRQHIKPQLVRPQTTAATPLAKPIPSSPPVAAMPRKPVSETPQPSARPTRRKVSSEGAGKSVVYEAGDLLFNQGDKADHLAIIMDGQVEIFNPTTDDRIALLGKGVSFGEQAILEGGVRGASARAHTRVTCLEINTEPLRSILKTDPGILTPVIEALLLQLNMANKISKSVDTEDIDYEVMSDSNFSSIQVQKMLNEVYTTGDNKGLNSDELMFLKLLASNKLQTTVHEAGAVLGTPQEEMLGLGYVVVQGHIEAVSDHQMYKLGPGSVFGLAEALIDRTLPWTLTAISSVTLMNFPIDKAIRGLEHANPGIRGIVRYTADRIVLLQSNF